nr:cytochrome P450 89A2-like [Ipomoea batatas]
METWFIILASLCIAFSLKSLLNLLRSSPSRRKIKNLPPGPTNVPIIGSFQWLRRSLADIEKILRELRSEYGPLITLRIGPNPAIFVASHSLAHQALVQNGAVFSDRPKATATSRVVSSNQCNISSAPYGPTWRLLRRNLTAEILHPSRIKSYSRARNWALGILLEKLGKHGESGEGVKLIDHFQYTVFCLLVLMCFGDKLEEAKIKEIEKVQRKLLLGFRRFNVINFFPRIGRIIFPGRWKELMETRQEQERIFVPLIHARARSKNSESRSEEIVAYVDSLLSLELPEEKRKLTDGEIVGLISEFLSGGTDTTATALQWIMANLVKNPEIQEKLYGEISTVLEPLPHNSPDRKIVREEDLAEMRYLKAVVLEGLRRHPPGHFVLPHTVTEEAELNGYTIPKNAAINFMVADMGLDPKVWDDPLEFKPERFLTGSQNEGAGQEMFDITGSREIKMMPFGAGRRICPGWGLAMLHLEYFLANLVWHFEWRSVEGEKVDLEEELEFTVVMKNPLRAKLRLRSSQS